MTYLASTDILDNCKTEMPLHRVVLHEDYDINGFYWEGCIGIPSSDNYYCFLSTDTLEEAQMWCDLHNIEVDAIEAIEDHWSA